MLKQILLASNNQHKVDEIASYLGSSIKLITPSQIGLSLDVEETESSLLGNAQLKAQQFFQASAIPSLADDTGLFINSLKGEPGVFSARYAGDPSNPQRNLEKVLSSMAGTVDRSAFFKTVLVLQVDHSTAQVFEGVVHGYILHEPIGINGFGYDSIFAEMQTGLSFAQMTAEQKNQVSHRSIALRNFMLWLNV